MSFAPDLKRKARIEEWAAQQLVDPASVLLLDTETTGLSTAGFDEVIEVGVIDATGKVLLESLCRPQNLARPDLGTHIHGITREELSTAPAFPVVFDDLVRVLRKARTILVYNLGYDGPMLTSTARRYSLALPSLPWGQCVMLQYSEWYGEKKYGGGYKWQRLNDACGLLNTPKVGTAHRAVGDALSTLEVLKALAALHPEEEDVSE